MLSGGYNNNQQIVQGDGVVAIMNEMSSMSGRDLVSQTRTFGGPDQTDPRHLFHPSVTAG
jgi:hypothetical protein